MLVRLQKIMAERGIASRRKSEEFILAGNVKVNGEVVTLLGTKIDPEKDILEVDGEALKKDKDKLVYYLLNKPIGYVATTHSTEVECDIVTDLVPKKPRVYPVGRLDKDTTGLLILTNDGDLTFKLTHPSFEHEKEYEVLVDKKISEKDLKYLASGSIVLFGKKVQKTEIISRSARSFSIILKEGMNRQIRRMVRSVGLRVLKLRRVRIGNLHIGDMEMGEVRKLTRDELLDLQSTGKTAH